MLKKKFETYFQNSMNHLEPDLDLKKRLKRELFAEGKKKRSFLSLISNIMKRYSFAYLAVFAILALVITAILPAKINPLSPEEVLAKALEQYQGDGIYHEKILTETSWDDPMIEGYQPIKKEEKVWERYTDEWGNSLSITKNLLTNELFVNLAQVNEFGDMAIYNYSPPIIPNELNVKTVTLPLNPEEKKWFDVFQGEKFYCYEKMEGKNRAGQGEVFLIMAAEDPSVYVLHDFIEKKEEEDSYYYNKLQSLRQRPSSQEESNSTKVFLETLMKNPDLEYKGLSKKNGRNYHVFEDEFNIKGSVSQSQYYIDAETYQLSYQKTEYSFLESEKEGEEERIVLVSEYLDSSQKDLIFDPARFGEMLKKEERPHYSFPPFLKESGCYNYKGDKLKDSFVDQLPAQVQESWQKSSSKMLSNDSMTPDDLEKISSE